MKKTNTIKIAGTASIFLIIAAFALISPASAIVNQNETSFFNTSDTSVSKTAFGDVDGDGGNELVAAGYYFNGATYVAYVISYNASTLAVENYREWILGQSTNIATLAIGNLTNTQGLSIVVGGSYYNGATWVALVAELDGTTFAISGYQEWIWLQNTYVSSLSIGNLTGGTTLDIVTGGSHYDGSRWVANIVVLNGSTLAIESYKEWVWGQSTRISTLTTGNLTGNADLDIITAGEYYNGANWVANVVVLSGPTLTITQYKDFLWAQDTLINSVVVSNVTGGASLDIITAGKYYSGANWVADIVIFDGSTLAIKTYKDWLYGQATEANSVTIGNFTGSNTLDVVTAGSNTVNNKQNGQVGVWDISTLSLRSITSWATVSNTTATSVNIGNAGAGNRVYTGGQYWDNTEMVAEFNIWG